MGRRGWGIGAAAACLAALPGLAAADPPKLTGAAEVEYQDTRAGGIVHEQSWLETFRSDYVTRLARTFDFAAQLQFTEQRYTGRLNRSRVPQGTLRLAHAYGGLFATYRPIEVRDDLGFTTRQQETMLTAYLQKAGLPRVTGSWNRRHVDASQNVPATSTIQRNVNAAYDVGPLSFNAGYGDQTRLHGNDALGRPDQDHFQAGSIARLDRRRLNSLLEYDFIQSRSFGTAQPGAVTRSHSATTNSSFQLGPRTGASLSYSYRLTDPGSGQPNLVEQDGLLNFSQRLTKALQASAGGGVRTANLTTGRETESYVITGLTAQAEARRGWRVAGGASQSWNWLPGDKARPSQGLQASTTMRLAPALELAGDASLATSERPPASTIDVGPSTQTILQTGATLRATPLRTITLNGGVRRYRIGASLTSDGQATTSSTASVGWRPSERLQTNATLSQTGGSGGALPGNRILQTSGQWTPTRTIQVSGAYVRSNNQTRDPNTQLTAGRESYSGRVVLALTRDLRATFQYSGADRGLPTHARQVTVIVTQSFRR